jgi:hypothetical protein
MRLSKNFTRITSKTLFKFLLRQRRGFYPRLDYSFSLIRTRDRESMSYRREYLTKALDSASHEWSGSEKSTIPFKPAATPRPLRRYCCPALCSKHAAEVAPGQMSGPLHLVEGSLEWCAVIIRLYSGWDSWVGTLTDREGFCEWNLGHEGGRCAYPIWWPGGPFFCPGPHCLKF